MSKTSSRVPSLCVHRSKKLAYVRLNGRMIYLGAAGSEESRREYERLIAEWLSAGRVHVESDRHQGVSVNEVLLAYRQYVGDIYARPGASPGTEIERTNLSLRPVMDLYGLTPADRFGPKALAAVQQAMATAGLARITVNQRINVVRRAFRWAAGQEMIPAGVYHGLQAVEGLRRGRTRARESVPVRPVEQSVIVAVIARLPPTLRAMVTLHELTGMRSGELIIMRPMDLDTTGEVWTYRPSKHKTQYRGHTRIVPIGPKAQDLIRPFMDVAPATYLFSPARARDERAAAKRAARKSKVQPSQVNRRRALPERQPGERFTPGSYRRALDYATQSAIRAGTLPEGTRWHPHQLRHNAATRLRKQFGLDTVRAILGHRTLTQSATYAELDGNLATVAAKTTG